ncbi:LCP family protein [Dictyobacter aurantiacus]|nr:LCP family protein [Dictyobacter aurantiacus]
MKNQFVHKPSRDGMANQQGSPPGSATGQNIGGNNTAEEQPQGPSAHKSGLLTRWKTGQLPPPQDQKAVRTDNLRNEPATDPLSQRQMPKPASQQGIPSSRAGSFSIPADSVPTSYQPAVPDMVPPSQIGLRQYPAVPPARPTFAGPPVTPQRPRITRDLNGYAQRPTTGQLNNPAQSQPGFVSGQWQNPAAAPATVSRNGWENYNRPASGEPPYMVAGPSKTGKADGRRHIPIWARVVIAILAFLVITGGGAFAYYQINFANSVNDITGNSALHDINGKNKTSQQPVNADPLTQRTNILLLGSDTDGKGNDIATGKPLAQTVIIITIDPKTNYVGMLSIPRDMQVSDQILGGQAKIDQIFENGWQGKTTKEKAQRAAGHTMDVIEENYGIHIDHYAWVGLQGFIKVIDTIGGVDIDAMRPVVDDAYPDDTNNSPNAYNYKRLDIAPGPQHFNGTGALEYVRSRHADLGGDFGRTQRQQQILSQIKVKLSGSDIVTKAPTILSDLDGYLLTDLTVSQLASFAQIAKNVDVNKVDRVSFTTGYSNPIPGNSNYAPNCQAIMAKIHAMFGITPNCIPQASVPGNTSTSVARIQTSGAGPAMATASIDKGSSQSGSGYQLTSLNTGSAIVSNKATFSNLTDLMLLTVSGSFNAMGK